MVWKTNRLVGFLLFFWCGSMTTAFSLLPSRGASLAHVIRQNNDIRFPATVDDAVESSTEQSMVGTVTFWIPSSSQLSKFGAKSPVGNPLLIDAVQHLAQKVNWMAENRLQVTVITTKDVPHPQVLETDVLLAIGLHSETDLASAQNIFQQRYRQRQNRQCQLALDCSSSALPAFVGPYDPQNPSLAAQYIPWSQDASGKRMYERMSDILQRWTSDEFCYAILLFLNQYSGHTIPWVQHTTEATWEKGLLRNAQEFYGIVSKCPNCLLACAQEPSCRECINVLGSIDARDQVASYRAIVSYESEALKQFSLCIMTKHNVFDCHATIPTFPKVSAVTTWRGKPLTVVDGKAILVGHLDDASAPDGSRRTDVSWKVACGANVAYDQFPCQNQVFYPQGSQNMWYDPVFRVQTLDGRDVWCHRHYRVRPQPQQPGVFRLSVLDNGVTSDELWHLVGVADDLSWACFHYAGAASAVGLQYTGGLLCTPDGRLPQGSAFEEAVACLQRAGIAPWELMVVDNDPASPGAVRAGSPPLNIYRSKSQQVQFQS
ncbi:hypothetical protein FisN_10Lh272 [Fistulifera solaris]|uniref:VDE lipocalin domain-containing protein n=1 Tax=Fistulifera solaris TaxID=1519565 RepID=A0A1Z5KFU2_FISSO|nr:hypothetical protein FisN_10Lh272 [Fistulifera solaris]|eukprot:GAX25076.1 hypothetical protein FisN_10Lh272 [Fistulifera solaris]